jgi:hypothetical protein
MWDEGVGDVVTYENDADGCGVVESTDWFNDGIADIVATTRCTAGRVTHQDERNMTNRDEDEFQSHRSVTPLSAEYQSDVALDFNYDASGRLLERKFEITTVLPDSSLPATLHDVFSYEGARSTGTSDQKGAIFTGWDPKKREENPPQSSATACTVATTCKAMPAIDASPLSLCAPGVGVNLWPAPYFRVPGLPGQHFGVSWDLYPGGFLDQPELSQMIGY